MNGLALSLRADRARFRADESISFEGRYTNVGPTPLALAFWWNRTIRLLDAAGREVPRGPGPVLPCGVAEEWTVLAPGASHERTEPLACTQPAGGPAGVGWSYAPSPGTYRATLVFEAPARHGFTQSEPHPHAFVGRVESNPVELVIDPPAPRGLLSRLFG